MDTVRVTARAALIDVLSCRRGMSNSGVISRIAGEAIGADAYLPDMGSEECRVCLSRQALEVVAKDVGIEPKARVRDTRAALVEHFAGDVSLVHASALFAPDRQDVTALLRYGEALDADDAGAETDQEREDSLTGDDAIDPDADKAVDGADDTPAEEVEEHATAYGLAAE